MQMMINRIIGAVPIDLYEHDHTHEETLKNLSSRVQRVEVEGIVLKMKFTKEDAEEILNKRILREEEFLEPEDAPNWLESRLLG